MITITNIAINYVGLSTDEKPVSAANGSSFLEMDTNTTYYFDAEGQTWLGGSDVESNENGNDAGHTTPLPAS